jgi:excisionase family DNA binding protein
VTTSKASGTGSPKLLTLNEAARALRIGMRAVLRLGDEGCIRVVRLGPRSVRVVAADIDALTTGTAARNDGGN